VDEPSPGNLGLPVSMFLTYFALLMPAFSLPCSPPVLTDRLLPTWNAPLPISTYVQIPQLRCNA